MLLEPGRSTEPGSLRHAVTVASISAEPGRAGRETIPARQRVPRQRLHV